MFEKIKGVFSQQSRVKNTYMPHGESRSYLRVPTNEFICDHISHPLARLFYIILGRFKTFGDICEQTGIPREKIQELLFECAPEFGSDIILHSKSKKTLKNVYKLANKPSDIFFYSIKLKPSDKAIRFIKAYLLPKETPEEAQVNAERKKLRLDHHFNRKKAQMKLDSAFKKENLDDFTADSSEKLSEANFSLDALELTLKDTVIKLIPETSDAIKNFFIVDQKVPQCLEEFKGENFSVKHSLLLAFFNKIEDQLKEVPIKAEIQKSFIRLKEEVLIITDFCTLLSKGAAIKTFQSDWRIDGKHSYLSNAAGTSFVWTLNAVSQIRKNLANYNSTVAKIYQLLDSINHEQETDLVIDRKEENTQKSKTKLLKTHSGWKSILSAILRALKLKISSAFSTIKNVSKTLTGITMLPLVVVYKVVKDFRKIIKDSFKSAKSILPKGFKFLSLPLSVLFITKNISSNIKSSIANSFNKLRKINLELFSRKLLSPKNSSVQFASNLDNHGLLKKLLDNPIKTGSIHGPDEFYNQLAVTDAYVLCSKRGDLTRLDEFLENFCSSLDSTSLASKLYQKYAVPTFTPEEFHNTPGSQFKTSCMLEISEGEIILPVPPGYEMIGLNFIDANNKVINPNSANQVSISVFGGCSVNAPVGAKFAVYILAEKEVEIDHELLKVLNKVLPVLKTFSPDLLKSFKSKFTSQTSKTSPEELLYGLFDSYEFKYTINPYITSFLKAAGENWLAAMLGLRAGTCSPLSILFLSHARDLGIPAFYLTGNITDKYSQSFILQPRHSVVGTLGDKPRLLDLTQNAIRDTRYDLYQPDPDFWREVERKLNGATAEQIFELSTKIRKNIEEQSLKPSGVFDRIKQLVKSRALRTKTIEEKVIGLGPEWISATREKFLTENAEQSYFIKCLVLDEFVEKLVKTAVEKGNSGEVRSLIKSSDHSLFRAKAYDLNKAQNHFDQKSIAILRNKFDPRLKAIECAIKLIISEQTEKHEKEQNIFWLLGQLSGGIISMPMFKNSPLAIKIKFADVMPPTLNPKFITLLSDTNLFDHFEPKSLLDFTNSIIFQVFHELFSLKMRCPNDTGILLSQDPQDSQHQNKLEPSDIKNFFEFFEILWDYIEDKKVSLPLADRLNLLACLSCLFAVLDRDTKVLEEYKDFPAKIIKKQLLTLFSKIIGLDSLDFKTNLIHLMLCTDSVYRPCVVKTLESFKNVYGSEQLSAINIDEILTQVPTRSEILNRKNEDFLLAIIDILSDFAELGISFDNATAVKINTWLKKSDLQSFCNSDPIPLGSPLNPSSALEEIFFKHSNFKAAKLFQAIEALANKTGMQIRDLLDGVSFSESQLPEENRENLVNWFLKNFELETSISEGMTLRVKTDKKDSSSENSYLDVRISDYPALVNNLYLIIQNLCSDEYLSFLNEHKKVKENSELKLATAQEKENQHGYFYVLFNIAKQLAFFYKSADHASNQLWQDFFRTEYKKEGILFLISEKLRSQFQQKSGEEKKLENLLFSMTQGLVLRLYSGIEPKEIYRSFVWLNYTLGFAKEEASQKNSDQGAFKEFDFIVSSFPNFAVEFPDIDHETRIAKQTPEYITKLTSLLRARIDWKLPKLPFDDKHENPLSLQAKSAALLTYGLVSRLVKIEKCNGMRRTDSDFMLAKFDSMLGLFGKLNFPACPAKLEEAKSSSSAWVQLFSNWPLNEDRFVLDVDLGKICDSLVAEFNNTFRTRLKKIRSAYRTYLIDKTGHFFPLTNSGEAVSQREYQVGDDPRRINWKLSARRDRKIVNVYEENEIKKVSLLIDVDYLVTRNELLPGEARARVEFDRIKEIMRHIFLANIQGLPLDIYITGRGVIKKYEDLGKNSKLLSTFILMRSLERDREKSIQMLYDYQKPAELEDFERFFKELTIIINASIYTLQSEAPIYGLEGFPSLDVTQDVNLKSPTKSLLVAFVSKKNMLASGASFSTLKAKRQSLAVFSE